MAITNRKLLFVIRHRNACGQTNGKCFVDGELDRDHILIYPAHQVRGINTEFVDIDVEGLIVLKLLTIFNSSAPTEISINVPSKVTSDAMIRTPLRN